MQRERFRGSGTVYCGCETAARHDGGWVLIVDDSADTSDAAFRPYVGFGLRAQLQGRKPEAFGGYAGAPLVLGAFGAQRAPLVGTVSAGVGYRLNDGIELFSTVEAQTGRDDHRESIATGVRLRF